MRIRHMLGVATMSLGAMAFALPASPAQAFHFADSFCAPHPTRTISVSDASAYENDGAKVKISLSGSACYSVKVNYNTQNGTAVAPFDYVAKPLTTVTFNPGETFKWVTVTTNADNVAEANEHFFVVLSTPVGGSIVDGSGQVTIVNGPEPAG